MCRLSNAYVNDIKRLSRWSVSVTSSYFDVSSADDMGLGKTLTTISHVLRMKNAREENSDAWQSREKELEKGLCFVGIHFLPFPVYPYLSDCPHTYFLSPL